MVTAFLSLAGLTVRVETVFDEIFRWGKDFLTDRAPDLCVHITEDDLKAEEEKARAESAYEGLTYPGYSLCELEYTAIYRKIAQKLPDFDAVVFHGSAVAVGQSAYLFTAKSGTGKTTHTNLWLKNIPGSYIVNGDKPILRRIHDEICVCGTPWMGKENLGNTDMVPLQGLCILNRGEQNTITPIPFEAAFPLLLGQSFRPPQKEGLVKTVRFLEGLGQTVPLYTLYCNMQDEAARVSFGGMTKR